MSLSRLTDTEHVAIKKEGCGGGADWEFGVWRRAWRPTPVFLPGDSPWTEEPGGLQSMGSQRVNTTERLSTHSYFVT